MTEKRFTANYQNNEIVSVHDNGNLINIEQMVKCLNALHEESQDVKEQLILVNAFIKMIENCYEDMTIEDILYEKYGEFQDELHLQMAIAKEEIE